MKLCFVDAVWHALTYQQLIAVAVVFLGALVQGVLGFGLAIISAPVLYIVAPTLVPGTLICLSAFIALLTLRRYLRRLELADMKYAIAGRLPGSVAGAYILAVASHQQMNLLMGGIVLLAVAVSLFPVKIRASRSSLLAAGIVSGITGTTASIAGPPIALVMQNESGDRIRASMSAYFAFSNIISVIILAAGNMFHWIHLKFALLLFPVVVAGSLVAGKIADKVDQQAIRMALLFLCSIAGITAISSAIP